MDYKKNVYGGEMSKHWEHWRYYNDFKPLGKVKAKLHEDGNQPGIPNDINKKEEQKNNDSNTDYNKQIYNFLKYGFMGE